MRPAIKPLSEAQIQRQILDMLRFHPKVGAAWRINTAGVPLHGAGQKGKFRPAPTRGISDIIAILKPNGQMLAIEVKSAKGRVSPDQKVFLDTVRSSGGKAIVARCWEDVEAYL